MLVESNDEYRARMRREQQHRQDQQRQDQQRRDDQRRQDQQRREDQYKRDEAERRRRSDDQARLAEEKRHNRAMETARARDSAPQRVDPPASRKQAAATTYSEPVRASRRTGGFTKLIILIALMWGAIHFWPEISGVVKDALASRHAPSSEAAADRAAAQSEPQADVPVAPKEDEPVRNAKPAAEKYPRCSATITDHCRED